jgi:hypothetical protein
MKTLGNKSLSAFLARAINIVWWLEWAGFAVMMIVGIALAIGKRAFTVNIPVTYSAITLRQIPNVNRDLPSGVLNSTNGNLYLNMDASWQNIVLLLAGMTMLFAAAILITFQLKVIFSNFRQNLPFQGPNISRIRNIAFILIAYSVVQWLFVIVVNQILLSNFRWEPVQLTYSFNLSALVTGLILIVVAEIFKLGASFENENKLTI